MLCLQAAAAAAEAQKRAAEHAVKKQEAAAKVSSDCMGRWCAGLSAPNCVHVCSMTGSFTRRWLGSLGGMGGMATMANLTVWTGTSSLHV